MNYADLFKKILKTKSSKYGEDVDISFELEGKRLYVYFVGSNSKTDWKNNFRFFAKMYKKQESPMLVHKGFAKAYKSCNDDIMQVIKGFRDQVGDGFEVFFVGHSFGGAMALLAAEDYFFRFQDRPYVDKANVFTFGAPKVFATKKSVEYVKSCVKEIKQFAHKSDIVTYMPPFYKHVKRVCLGKFSIVNLFKPNTYHLIYDELNYEELQG